MKTPKPPRTTEQATELLGRYAEADTALAAIEARRKTALGRINAAADAKATPLLEQIAVLSAQLQPWWTSLGHSLAPKGRKSLQLGGCMIGTRSARATLGHGFETDDKAVEALRGTRYAKQTTRVKYSIDRTATLKLLQLKGKAGQALGELGFKVVDGETFFIDRVEQAGTMG